MQSHSYQRFRLPFSLFSFFIKMDGNPLGYRILRKGKTSWKECREDGMTWLSRNTILTNNLLVITGINLLLRGLNFIYDNQNIWKNLNPDSAKLLWILKFWNNKDNKKAESLLNKRIQLNVNLSILGVRHCQGRGLSK